MDDELPLTALKKPKKSNFDDDLPLAKLATSGGKPSIGRPSAGRPSVGGQAPGAAGKPKPKGVKKGGSSSSSSSSSYTPSDSSSASNGKKKVKGAVTKKSRIRLLAKKRAEQEEGGEDNQDNKIKKKDRTPKEEAGKDKSTRKRVRTREQEGAGTDESTHDRDDDHVPRNLVEEARERAQFRSEHIMATARPYTTHIPDVGRPTVRRRGPGNSYRGSNTTSSNGVFQWSRSPTELHTARDFHDALRRAH